MQEAADGDDEDARAVRYAYPTAAMIGDYLRAAAGLLAAGVIFAALPFSAASAVVLGGFALIFAIFGLRTAVRHGTSLRMTDTQLQAQGLSRRTIEWAELDRLKLAYYSTRRDRKDGWMQLELGAGAARLGIDSRIEGFDRLVRRAAEAAATRRIELNDATIANLRSLGLDGAARWSGR
ncbi:MAG TPA: hypothetical protein VME41_18675 [Stellaceae bacterium]|nr:hypothetical protein [Stellaceae bacterium]